MRIVLATWLVLVSSVASAGTLGGNVVGIQPANDLADGGITAWLAGEVGSNGYLGGEISIGSYVTPNDAGVSYHALAGLRSRLSTRALVLADVGAGATQQVAFHLGLFGGEEGFDTVRWLPSGAARVQLVGELGKVGASTVGVTLSTEARIGVADGDATTGVGVGLGLYLAR